MTYQADPFDEDKLHVLNVTRKINTLKQNKIASSRKHAYQLSKIVVASSRKHVYQLSNTTNSDGSSFLGKFQSMFKSFKTTDIDRIFLTELLLWWQKG